MHLESELNRPLRGRFTRIYSETDRRPLVVVGCSGRVSTEDLLGAASTLSLLLPDFQVCTAEDLSDVQVGRASAHVIVIPKGADPAEETYCAYCRDVLKREFVVLECGTILRFGHPLLLEIADLHHRRIQALQPRPCLLLRAWAALRRYFDLRAAL